MTQYPCRRWICLTIFGQYPYGIQAISYLLYSKYVCLMNIAFFFVSLYAFAADCELSAYPAPHFWLSVFWVRGIQELFIYLCLNAAKRNETKDKWFLEFPSTGAFVGSVF